ncbi:hypothetical protein PC110_g1494 [Phytophthora cactorum]|uniref:Uncharacterized protein n=1 Tax=Phytophthora cactorum TaxID=29920 RepID=A0A329T0J7_9STRA|nr:hypothetical protein PC110_g1708 [Phytophthora cactorum]RAW42330.1 hypothetical protein PC110_g1494 [Phytophthora cactorum]
MFNALKRAAELAGRPGIVTQRDIDEFVAAELDSNGRDLTKGTTWKVVLRFPRRLRGYGRDFVYNANAKDNFPVAGRRGARILAEIGLVDGIYLVAAYNHSFVGHGIVLTVQGNKQLIYDLEEGKPIASAEDWINFYAFVRPFIVYKLRSMIGVDSYAYVIRYKTRETSTRENLVRTKTKIPVGKIKNAFE